KPDAQLIQAIHKLTCSQVAWVAKLICYRANDYIIFGDKSLTVSEFCKEWEPFTACSFQVKAWAGPPGKQAWYTMTLAEYVVDWYFRAIVENRDILITNMGRSLLRP